MKVKENITMYQCDFCNKRLLVKNAMIRHENACSKSPENHSECETCGNLEETEIAVEDYMGITRKAKAFRCKHFDKLVYPAKVVHRKLLEKYPETFAEQMQMPKTCEHCAIDLPF